MYNLSDSNCDFYIHSHDSECEYRVESEDELCIGFVRIGYCMYYHYGTDIFGIVGVLDCAYIFLEEGLSFS